MRWCELLEAALGLDGFNLKDSCASDFIQTYRSQKAVDRIRGEVAPTATVLRDNKWFEVARREVVPGDINSRPVI
jgi:magnesium-transporting ATPase (P-type)